MTDILSDLKSAASRKWAGDPAAQQAGLFARAAAEIERLRNDLALCREAIEVCLEVAESLPDDPDYFGSLL